MGFPLWIISYGLNLSPLYPEAILCSPLRQIFLFLLCPLHPHLPFSLPLFLFPLFSVFILYPYPLVQINLLCAENLVMGCLELTLRFPTFVSVGSPETGIIDGCEPTSGCWESNLGPFKEQKVLLTIELSRQPLYFFISFYFLRQRLSLNLRLTD